MDCRQGVVTPRDFTLSLIKTGSGKAENCIFFTSCCDWLAGVEESFLRSRKNQEQVSRLACAPRIT
jgi:hypothetical protein